MTLLPLYRRPFYCQIGWCCFGPSIHQRWMFVPQDEDTLVCFSCS